MYFLTQLEDVLFNILFSLTVLDVMAGASGFSESPEGYQGAWLSVILIIITPTMESLDFNVPK